MAPNLEFEVSQIIMRATYFQHKNAAEKFECFFTNLPMTESATLELVKVEGRSGWDVRQAPERSRKKHIDLWSRASDG